MTSQGSTGTRFARAVRSRNLFLAEAAAFEMGQLTLEDALALVVLYGEGQDDKFDKAAVRWLGQTVAGVRWVDVAEARAIRAARS